MVPWAAPLISTRRSLMLPSPPKASDQTVSDAFCAMSSTLGSNATSDRFRCSISICTSGFGPEWLPHSAFMLHFVAQRGQKHKPDVAFQELYFFLRDPVGEKKVLGGMVLPVMLDHQ